MFVYNMFVKTRDVTVEIFQLRPLQWLAESAPLGWDRVKVSDNLGATSVAPVAPVVTSLKTMFAQARTTRVILVCSSWSRPCLSKTCLSRPCLSRPCLSRSCLSRPCLSRPRLSRQGHFDPSCYKLVSFFIIVQKNKNNNKVTQRTLEVNSRGQKQYAAA